VKITKLRAGNSQLPSEKSIYDIVLLSSKDMFCWDGTMWQLIGGRFLPKEVIDVFLSYVSEGFPDIESLEWDLNFLLDTYDVLGKVSDYYIPESVASLTQSEQEDFCRKSVKKFINRILEVYTFCQKNLSSKDD
jgi:hypothetical protein